MITLIIFTSITDGIGLNLLKECTEFQVALIFVIAIGSDLNLLGHILGKK